MTENDNKQPHTVGRQLASGVFYTSIAKYAGIVVTLVVSGVLARLFTPEEFGVVNIATVVIAFFAIFSDLGIGPAVIQHKNLDKRDLGGIFSLTLWSGAVMALLFFAASGLIASFYDDSAELRNILRILSANLFFAAANIVPNGLILKEKRFRFAAVRSLSVQVVGGAAAIAASGPCTENASSTAISNTPCTASPAHPAPGRAAASASCPAASMHAAYSAAAEVIAISSAVSLSP